MDIRGNITLAPSVLSDRSSLLSALLFPLAGSTFLTILGALYSSMPSLFQLVRLLPALGGLISSATCTTTGDSIDIRALFGPGLSSGANVYIPGDAGYFSTNERWSNLQNPSYVAAIQPASEEDVVYIVSVLLSCAGSNLLKLLGTNRRCEQHLLPRHGDRPQRQARVHYRQGRSQH